MPDNNWGPSWVTWVNYDGYYGWQPMQPGVSVNLSFGHNYHNSYNHWVFVRHQDFERNDLQNYSVQHNDRFIRNSRVIDRTSTDRKRRTTYVTGPSRSDVQRSTGRRIRPVIIEETQQPGQELNNGRLSIYRPEVRRSVNPEERAVPRKVYDVNEVRRPTERSSSTPNINNRQERSYTPSNNENRSVPYQQKTETQSVPNGRFGQQERTVTPQNENRQVQTGQQRNETQSGSTKPVQSTKQRSVETPANVRQVEQTKTVVPQGENLRVEPTRQSTVKPAMTPTKDKSANEVKPKTDPKRETKKEDNKRR